MKKLHKLLLSFSIILLFSVFVQPNTCVAKNAVHLNLIDLMPDFFSYCSEARALNSAERVQLFKKELLEPHQIAFDAALQSSMGKPKDASVAKYLSLVEERLPSIRTTTGEFSNAFSQSCESFEKIFPHMNRHLNVYLMPSFYTFDGMTSEVKSKRVMLFGADVLADSYKTLSGSDFKTFVSHELFHIYHHQIAPAAFDEYVGSMHVYKPLYLCLWTEGLACYVSHVINPGSSLAETVLDKTLAEQGPASIHESAKEFVAAFSSTAPNEHARFFAAGTKTTLPARSGYYLGMIVAQRVSQRYSLRGLVRLSGRKLEKEIKDALNEIVANRAN